MRLPALLVSDLHLTASPADAYRWGLFRWLLEQAAAHRVQTIAILGDVTDAKDYHSAELVNRVVSSVASLAEAGYEVIILMGNHDYQRDGQAYFRFLNSIPKVRYITRPTDTSAEGAACLWLPHTRNPAKDWAGLDLSHFRFVFMHQTVKGAKASNGQVMDGEAMPDLTAAGKVYSGDIHVPQIIGGVEYVGSPYHVHFGDRFKPRGIVLRGRDATDVRYPCLHRFTLDTGPDVADLDDHRLHEGDQVKLRVHLERADLHQWAAIRRRMAEALAERKVECHGIELVAPKTKERVVVGAEVVREDPATVITRFVTTEDWGGDMLDAGLEILEDAIHHPAR